MVRGPTCLDELHLTATALVPEIKLYLAEDPIIFWARLEADAKTTIPAPFWASAWAGGQALARYLLDHPESVAGKRVLDFGSGSGLAAIAAARAGATAVTANDIASDAIMAIAANAATNGVDVELLGGDLLRQRVDAFDVVLAGDALYAPSLAADLMQFLQVQVSRGSRVLLGDPGRGHLPQHLHLLATYPIVDSMYGDAEIEHASVYLLQASRPSRVAMRSSLSART
jgi:predicted nicotinamide N-methyase